MALVDYSVPRDRFHALPQRDRGPFPCDVCVHRALTRSSMPCQECGHRLNKSTVPAGDQPELLVMVERGAFSALVEDVERLAAQVQAMRALAAQVCPAHTDAFHSLATGPDKALHQWARTLVSA